VGQYSAGERYWLLPVQAAGAAGVASDGSRRVSLLSQSFPLVDNDLRQAVVILLASSKFSTRFFSSLSHSFLLSLLSAFFDSSLFSHYLEIYTF
jgi:hypothetical protein